ncbi:type I toxin-antitoxin system SymE family toxin [Pectobacterium polaris]|uniref:SymE family type I addiction module toxin n=1 Tax=Pectobacterium polaris TaxID=2042057 RepID=UPI001581BEC7|nr:SymE family type I addiction module toxin [Pectobacterium polaris]MCU1799155.1 type I toxin-antitoxin system SymE family toxin [Pectobacterium polaris]
MGRWCFGCTCPLSLKCSAKFNLTSAISLKGRWLEKSGFMTGMPITVTVEWGRSVGSLTDLFIRRFLQLLIYLQKFSNLYLLVEAD